MTSKKIGFKDLSVSLKTLVIMGWGFIAYFFLVFLTYFIIGFIEGLTGVALL